MDGVPEHFLEEIPVTFERDVEPLFLAVVSI